MINPLESLSQLTQDPALAAALMDYTLWLTHTPNVTKTSDYDELLDYLYAKVGDFRAQRNAYIKRRLAA